MPDRDYRKDMTDVPLSSVRETRPRYVPRLEQCDDAVGVCSCSGVDGSITSPADTQSASSRTIYPTRLSIAARVSGTVDTVPPRRPAATAATASLRETIVVRESKPNR